MHVLLKGLTVDDKLQIRPGTAQEHSSFHFMPERNVVTSFLNSTQILQQQKFVTD